jgi:hypothetical protein
MIGNMNIGGRRGRGKIARGRAMPPPSQPALVDSPPQEEGRVLKQEHISSNKVINMMRYLYRISDALMNRLEKDEGGGIHSCWRIKKSCQQSHV